MAPWRCPLRGWRAIAHSRHMTNSASSDWFSLFCPTHHTPRLLLLGLTASNQLRAHQPWMSLALLLGGNLRLRQLALIRVGWVLFSWCVTMKPWPWYLLLPLHQFPAVLRTKPQMSHVVAAASTNRVLSTHAASSSSWLPCIFSSLASLDVVQFLLLDSFSAVSEPST